MPQAAGIRAGAAESRRRERAEAAAQGNQAALLLHAGGGARDQQEDIRTGAVLQNCLELSLLGQVRIRWK